MISFSQYTEMHFLRSQDKLKVKQIAEKMSLDSKTVAKGLACVGLLLARAALKNKRHFWP